jgi:hypothetical protein
MPKENRRVSSLPSRPLANPEEVCHRLVPPQYWVGFEQDPDNERSNIEKHSVDFADLQKL